MSANDTSSVYEEPIEIPLDNDEEDDNMDSMVEDNANGKEQSSQNAVGSGSTSHDDEDEEEEEHDHEEEEDQDDEEDDDDSKELITTSGTATPTRTLTPMGSANGKTTKEEGPQKKVQKVEPNKVPLGKKVPLHLLEKRRLGRIKAAKEFAKKLKEIGIEKVESVPVPMTGMFQPLLLINQKNYSSDYLRKDEQIFALRERKTLRSNTTQNISSSNTPDVTDLQSVRETSNFTTANGNNDEILLNDPNTTIVIHPGSSFLKVGFALDEVPELIPNCVALPKTDFNNTNIIKSKQTSVNIEDNEKFESLKAEMEESFEERMRYYKRRIQPNGHDQVVSFNRLSKPESLPVQNDPAHIDWITDGTKRFYGDDALRCTDENFIKRYPFKKGGSFNTSSNSYKSLQDLLSDVVGLIEGTLSSDKFNIKSSQFSQYKVVLVIPDSFEKSHVELFIRLLVTELQFQAVAIIQESLSVCYGSGLGGSTCVVNVGSKETTVACVDEGIVLDNSLITLDYGSNDVTKLFAKFLLDCDFPYKNWDLNSTEGWRLAEELMKQCVTFQDADITVQLSNFIKRTPRGNTVEKLDFKVFEEVMLAPLALFYPEIFKLLRSKESEEQNAELEYQLPPSRDIFTDKINDWRSLSQNDCINHQTFCDIHDEYELLKKAVDCPNTLETFMDNPPEEKKSTFNFTPLDKAIVESITTASLGLDVSKMATFYSNILVVGGGSKIPGFDLMLMDRVNIWRPRLLSLRAFTHFYRELTKQLKELQSLKTGDGEEEIKEDELNEKISELIKTELTKYLEVIEQQSGNEHFLPVEVIPSPNEIDPGSIAWKGASVLAQIKLVEELFITNGDWDVHGNRILQYKSILTY